MKQFKYSLVTAAIILLAQTFTGTAFAILTIEELHKTFEKEIARLPKGLELSLYIEQLGSDRLVFSYNPDMVQVPASATKIISTAAALEYLGADYTVPTEVLVEGRLNGTTIEGNLVLRGEGDPYFTSEKLWLLVRELYRKGVRNVTGGIKINNSYFEGANDDLLKFGRGQPYAAMLAATSLNFNSIEVHVIPSVKVDNRPLVELGPIPNQYAKIQNDVRFSSGGGLYVKAVGIDENKEVLKVFGEVVSNSSSKVVYYPVTDPALYVAEVFKSLVEKEGIQLGKGYLGTTDFATGPVLVKHNSLPMQELVRLSNTYSNNFMAEQILRIVGAKLFEAPATPEKSTKAMAKYLATVPECNKEEIRLVNGSGFSWEGKISSRCFVRVIQKSYREFKWFADLLGSMPIGNHTGTLKSRFNGFGTWFTPESVRAKTGTLWSQGAVTSLVGFVPTASGEILIFAFLLNHKRRGVEPIDQMRRWEEKSVSYLHQLKLE